MMVGREWERKTPHTSHRMHTYPRIQIRQAAVKAEMVWLEHIHKNSSLLPPSLPPSFLSYLCYSINKATWQQGHLTLTLLRRTRGSVSENVHAMTIVGNGSTSSCPFLSFTASVTPDLGITPDGGSWALPEPFLKNKKAYLFLCSSPRGMAASRERKSWGWRWDRSWLWAVPCVWGVWRRSPFQQLPSMMAASPAWTVGDTVRHRNHTQIPTFHCVLTPTVCFSSPPPESTMHVSLNWSKSKPARFTISGSASQQAFTEAGKPWSQDRSLSGKPPFIPRLQQTAHLPSPSLPGKVHWQSLHTSDEGVPHCKISASRSFSTACIWRASGLSILFFFKWRKLMAQAVTWQRWKVKLTTTANSSQPWLCSCCGSRYFIGTDP